MKRALFLLAVTAAAVTIAVLVRRVPEAPEPAEAPRSVAQPASAGANTWVATMPARGAHTEATSPRVIPAARPAGPKPPTDSRTALMDSHVPAIAVASFDQVDSPRQRLLAQNRGPSEARQAQVERLGDRAAAGLARLKSARADAQGEERARLDRAIAAIERNQTFRSRITAGKTPPTSARPGTDLGPLPQHVKPSR